MDAQPAAPEHPPGAALQEALAEAQHLLGHRFANESLLREALTHRSAARYARSSDFRSNERLEFIGDRVLGLVMAEWLIQRFPAEPEGALGPRLAHLVSGPAIASIAERVGLAALLQIAPGEERAGVRTRASVVADATEALIGAMYLDAGLAPAQAFIRTAWETTLAGQSAPPKDAKSRLQEWALARGHKLPSYRIDSSAGPPHAPVFVVEVQLRRGDAILGTAMGEAHSKRQAEQLAATALLHTLHTAA